MNETPDTQQDRFVIRDSQGALWHCVKTVEELKTWLTTGNNLLHRPRVLDTKTGCSEEIVDFTIFVGFMNQAQAYDKLEKERDRKTQIAMSHDPYKFNVIEPNDVRRGVSNRPIYDIFEKAKALIYKKGSDYSDKIDWHSNFKYAKAVADPFPTRYKPYAMLIGVKLARLSQLLQEERDVNNEPTEDSFVDTMNYIALMAERYELEKPKPGDDEYERLGDNEYEREYPDD